MLKTGDLVEGRYKILDTLDEGGMGTVLLAEHVLIKRRVAIKLLHADLAGDPAVVERFMNEASVAGRLGHPNIVESTDMGFTQDQVPFIVFEYLEGALLTNEVYRLSGLTVRRALKIAHQIASALEAAHTAGIVHRDLKTDNVFLINREDVVDHVKVLDFGVSRFIEADDSNMVVGTPEYMAPEQILAPDKVDRRADIYSLGIVLYEMITARRPFQNDGGDVQALLHRIVHEAPPPLTRGEAPIGLQEMIFSKLLAKNPDERYQTMKDVQGAIAAFTGLTRPTPTSIQAFAPQSAVLTPLPGALPATPAQPAAPAVADAVPVPAAAKRRRAPIALLLAAIVLACAGVALAFVPPEQDTSATTSQATIDDDAMLLGAAFEAVANANQLRAESLATAPMIRAAIETDRATFLDMAKSGDFTFVPKAGETLEVFQRTDSMMRIPEGVQGFGATPGIRYVARGGEVVAVAGVPIKAQVDGLVVIAAPVDLAPIKQRLSEHTFGASIVGLGERVTLLAPSRPGTATSAPIKVGAERPISLEVVIATPTTTTTDRFATVRLALWGAGGLMFIIFLFLLLMRSRGH